MRTSPLAFIAVLISTALSCYAQAQSIGTNLVVDTFAGSAFSGTVAGQGTRSMFEGLGPIVFGDGGILYCWQSNYYLRTVDTNAVVKTVALTIGNGSPSADDLIYHDGAVYQTISTGFLFLVSPTGSTSFIVQYGGNPIIWDLMEKAYFSSGSTTIRKIVNGTVSTFVGSGNSGQIDGTGLFCSFDSIRALFVNTAGELLVVDVHSLRKVTMNGDVTTLVPEGKFVWDGVVKSLLLEDGRILAAKGNQVIVFGVDGSQSILAGSIQQGFQDGPAETAMFNSIAGMTLAPNGDLFISDSGNNRIRRIRSAVSAQTPPAARADIALFAGITITGIPGRSYRVESSPTADAAPWTEEASLQLPDSPYLWLDKKAVSGARKFYRVISL